VRLANLPNHTPRRAYCTGCGNTFNKMHHMINHRRTFRCGGRFLPEEEKDLLLLSNFLANFTTSRAAQAELNGIRVRLSRLRQDRLQEAKRAQKAA